MNIKFDTVYDENINIYYVDEIREDFEGNIHLIGNDMSVCIDQKKDCKIVLCYANGLVFKDEIIKGNIDVVRGFIEMGDDIK